MATAERRSAGRRPARALLGALVGAAASGCLSPSPAPHDFTGRESRAEVQARVDPAEPRCFEESPGAEVCSWQVRKNEPGWDALHPLAGGKAKGLEVVCRFASRPPAGGPTHGAKQSDCRVHAWQRSKTDPGSAHPSPETPPSVGSGARSGGAHGGGTPGSVSPQSSR